jgi:hypothetical protein
MVWGQRKKRHLQFNVLKNISNGPTLIIPWGGDGGVQHAVTIVGHYIFDSSTHHALRLTRDSLDWYCNTALGFKGVHFAIDFGIRSVKFTNMQGFGRNASLCLYYVFRLCMLYYVTGIF